MSNNVLKFFEEWDELQKDLGEFPEKQKSASDKNRTIYRTNSRRRLSMDDREVEIIRKLSEYRKHLPKTMFKLPIDLDASFEDLKGETSYTRVEKGEPFMISQLSAQVTQASLCERIDFKFDLSVHFLGLSTRLSIQKMDKLLPHMLNFMDKTYQVTESTHIPGLNEDPLSERYESAGEWS